MLSGATKPGVFKVYYILSGRNILVVKGSGLIIASIYQSLTPHWPPKAAIIFGIRWSRGTVQSLRISANMPQLRLATSLSRPATDAELELIWQNTLSDLPGAIVMKQNREWSFNSMNLGGSLPLLLEAGSNENKCLVEVPERIETYSPTANIFSNRNEPYACKHQQRWAHCIFDHLGQKTVRCAWPPTAAAHLPNQWLQGCQRLSKPQSHLTDRVKTAKLEQQSLLWSLGNLGTLGLTGRFYLYSTFLDKLYVAS